MFKSRGDMNQITRKKLSTPWSLIWSHYFSLNHITVFNVYIVGMSIFPELYCLSWWMLSSLLVVNGAHIKYSVLCYFHSVFIRILVESTFSLILTIYRLFLLLAAWWIIWFKSTLLYLLNIFKKRPIIVTTFPVIWRGHLPWETYKVSCAFNFM